MEAVNSSTHCCYRLFGRRYVQLNMIDKSIAEEYLGGAMRKRRLYSTVAILISILVMQIPSISRAQSPAIANGLKWLNSVQTPDGSWDTNTSATDSVQATSAVLESLTVLNGTATPNYVNAANWLSAQQLDTTRYLAGRLSIFPTFIADKDTMLLYLDELSRAWGGYDDFTVNNLDTALALSALKAINYPDQNIISSALYYLTSTQNSDGGWGFYQGDASNVYMTAMVSSTLQQFPRTTAIATAINRATSYLIAHQNADGGFGSSPFNAYETALSFIALIELGERQAQPLQNSINYITSTQSSNGSWNDDPYSMALALQALAKKRPNLEIASSVISYTTSVLTSGRRLLA